LELLQYVALEREEGMDHDKLIKGTNKVALYATVALVYWVFVFLLITAFDLRIFRERMTEIFYLSLFGIFAILGGAIILNVMSNLSKISTVMSKDHGYTLPDEKVSRTRIMVFALSFPLICVVLFGGNYLPAEKKVGRSGRTPFVKPYASMEPQGGTLLLKLRGGFCID
jgi:hypothetical protein